MEYPFITASYSNWFFSQSNERQAAALAHMENCEALKRALQENPYSEEARRLTRKVQAYYAQERE